MMLNVQNSFKNTLQNKAVKIVGGANHSDQATPFYSKLHIF